MAFKQFILMTACNCVRAHDK